MRPSKGWRSEIGDGMSEDKTTMLVGADYTADDYDGDAHVPTHTSSGPIRAVSFEIFIGSVNIKWKTHQSKPTTEKIDAGQTQILTTSLAN